MMNREYRNLRPRLFPSRVPSPRVDAAADAAPHGAGGSVAVDEIEIGAEAMLAFRLGSAAVGSPRQFLTEAICRQAEHIGLPQLADAQDAAKTARRWPVELQARDASCLTGVPEGIGRSRERRFESGP